MTLTTNLVLISRQQISLHLRVKRNIDGLHPKHSGAVWCCCRLLLTEKRKQLGSQAAKLRGGLTTLAETGQQVCTVLLDKDAGHDAIDNACQLDVGC